MKLLSSVLLPAVLGYAIISDDAENSKPKWCQNKMEKNPFAFIKACHFSDDGDQKAAQFWDNCDYFCQALTYKKFFADNLIDDKLKGKIMRAIDRQQNGSFRYGGGLVMQVADRPNGDWGMQVFLCDKDAPAITAEQTYEEIMENGCYWLDDYEPSAEQESAEAQESFGLLESWGEAVVRGDKPAVLAHYAEGATLWPTLSNYLRQTEAWIGDYFDLFLPKLNGVDPVEWNQNVYQFITPTNCIWSGIYTFHLNSGATEARYTYVLNKNGDNWEIMHHHSSLMPEN